MPKNDSFSSSLVIGRASEAASGIDFKVNLRRRIYYRERTNRHVDNQKDKVLKLVRTVLNITAYAMFIAGAGCPPLLIASVALFLLSSVLDLARRLYKSRKTIGYFVSDFVHLSWIDFTSLHAISRTHTDRLSYVETALGFLKVAFKILIDIFKLIRVLVPVIKLVLSVISLILVLCSGIALVFKCLEINQKKISPDEQIAKDEAKGVLFSHFDKSFDKSKENCVRRSFFLTKDCLDKIFFFLMFCITGSECIPKDSLADILYRLIGMTAIGLASNVWDTGRSFKMSKEYSEKEKQASRPLGYFFNQAQGNLLHCYPTRYHSVNDCTASSFKMNIGEPVLVCSASMDEKKNVKKNEWKLLYIGHGQRLCIPLNPNHSEQSSIIRYLSQQHHDLETLKHAPSNKKKYLENAVTRVLEKAFLEESVDPSLVFLKSMDNNLKHFKPHADYTVIKHKAHSPHESWTVCARSLKDPNQVDFCQLDPKESSHQPLIQLLQQAILTDSERMDIQRKIAHCLEHKMLNTIQATQCAKKY